MKTKKKINAKKVIIAIIECILKCITILAVILLLHCPIAMAEAWSISGTPLILFIVCSAWLGLIGIYTYIVNK